MTAEKSTESEDLLPLPELSPASRTPRPVLAAALALAIGGFVGSSPLLSLPKTSLQAVLACLVFATLRLDGKHRLVSALTALFAFGMLRAHPSEPGSERTGEAFEQGRVEWVRTGSESSRLRLAESPSAAESAGANQFKTTTGTLAAGDRVIRLPGGVPTMKPQGFVQRGNSGRRNRIAEIDVQPDEWVRLPPVSSLATWSSRLGESLRLWRVSLARRFRSLQDEQTSKLLSSICFGIVLESPMGRRMRHDERGGMHDGGDADLFTRTGTRHLLAVSGLHVGLVAWMLFGPLSRGICYLLRPLLREKRRELIADAVTLAALVSFVTLAGARAPVQRAGLALGCMILAARVLPADAFARLLGIRRRVDPLSALGVALLVECLVHPAAARSLSVQLSYAATLGLLLWTRPLAAHLRPFLSLSKQSPAGRSRAAVWQRPLSKLLSVFSEGFAASLAATLATLPFAAATFGEFSAVGAVATPLCLPLFALLLVGAWIYWAFPLPWLGEALIAGTHALFTMLEFFDRLPGTPIQLPPRPFALVALACWCAGQSLLRRTPLPARVAALTGGLLLLPWTSAPRALELIALDVGHGTAVLLRAPGEPALVFDAGSRDRKRVADEAVLPQLRAWDPQAIRIVCSHAHRDHASALPRLARRFAVTEWLGAPPVDWLAAERARATYREIDQEEEGWLTCSSRGTWRLWLGRGSIDSPSLNECSRDLLLEHRETGRRILLCGDAEGEGRAALLRTLPSGGPLELCLLPHHGTARSQLGPLLDALAPRRIWISRGEIAPAEAELDRRGLRPETTFGQGPLRLEGPFPVIEPSEEESVRKAHALQRSGESR